MDYDLLVKKSLQIENGGNLAARGLGRLSRQNPDTYYVIPDLAFTCSGNITGFIMGVRVRDQVIRIQYPEVFIVTDINNEYDFKVSQKINLTAMDFQTDGVYEYTLSVPLPFQEGQLIGIKQPNRSTSSVEFYYQRTSLQQFIRVVSSNNGLYTFNNMFNGIVLLHPITSKVTIEIIIII